MLLLCFPLYFPVHAVLRWSIIQHHMPLYLLSSNMDQCLALTSAVTALPAVSVLPDDDGGDGGAGLPANLSRSGRVRRTGTEANCRESFGWEHGRLLHLAHDEMLRSGGLCRSGRGLPRFGTAPGSALAVEAI